MRRVVLWLRRMRRGQPPGFFEAQRSKVAADVLRARAAKDEEAPLQDRPTESPAPSALPPSLKGGRRGSLFAEQALEQAALIAKLRAMLATSFAVSEVRVRPLSWLCLAPSCSQPW